MLDCESPRSRPLDGELSVVASADRWRVEAAATAASWMFVPVSPPPRASRGLFAEHVESAIESALSRRAAPPSGVVASDDPDATLSDQLFRARLSGAKGIVIAVDGLTALSVRGCLDPFDAQALAFYAAATRDRPFSLVLPCEARELRGFGEPVPLLSLLGESPAPAPSLLLAAEPVAPVVREVVADLEVPSLTMALESTTGPRPLADVERVFVDAYMPLVDHGLQRPLPERTLQAMARWSSGFAKSYTEAHAAFRLTNKRPPMVLDLPRIAAKIGRLHGARSTELVLVDAMRFDLGERLCASLAAATEGRATCAEKLLLWSALPTNTTTQLVTLAGGVDALDRPVEEEPDASLVARGRAASSLRRVRISGKDVFKLDVFEARLAEPNVDAAALTEAVQRATDALARHLVQRAERTLVVIFGDHGFKLDAGARGLSPSQGGASPEEVIVPAYAWLVGGVH